MKVNFLDKNVLLLHTFYERKGAKKAQKCTFSDQINVFEGRTTSSKRHIETSTKDVVLKAHIYPFRCDKFNRVYINGLEIDEILTLCFHVWGYST